MHCTVRVSHGKVWRVFSDLYCAGLTVEAWVLLLCVMVVNEELSNLPAFCDNVLQVLEESG